MDSFANINHEIMSNLLLYGQHFYERNNKIIVIFFFMRPPYRTKTLLVFSYVFRFLYLWLNLNNYDTVYRWDLRDE